MPTQVIQRQVQISRLFNMCILEKKEKSQRRDT